MPREVVDDLPPEHAVTALRNKTERSLKRVPIVLFLSFPDPV